MKVYYHKNALLVLNDIIQDGTRRGIETSDTYNHREDMKKNGGSWNKSLGGWVFSHKKSEEILRMVNYYNNIYGFPHQDQILSSSPSEPSSSVSVSNQKEFTPILSSMLSSTFSPLPITYTKFVTDQPFVDSNNEKIWKMMHGMYGLRRKYVMVSDLLYYGSIELGTWLFLNPSAPIFSSHNGQTFFILNVNKEVISPDQIIDADRFKKEKYTNSSHFVSSETAGSSHAKFHNYVHGYHFQTGNYVELRIYKSGELSFNNQPLTPGILIPDVEHHYSIFDKYVAPPISSISITTTLRKFLNGLSQQVDVAGIHLVKTNLYRDKEIHLIFNQVGNFGSNKAYSVTIFHENIDIDFQKSMLMQDSSENITIKSFQGVDLMLVDHGAEIKAFNLNGSSEIEWGLVKFSFSEFDPPIHISLNGNWKINC